MAAFVHPPQYRPLSHSLSGGQWNQLLSAIDPTAFALLHLGSGRHVVVRNVHQLDWRILRHEAIPADSLGELLPLRLIEVTGCCPEANLHQDLRTRAMRFQRQSHNTIPTGTPRSTTDRAIKLEYAP